MSFRRNLQHAFYGNVARDLLARIATARAAVGEGQDGEALHDWRVLVRRLIECSRAWAPRSLRRPVLDLARPWMRATNAARDREVEQALLGQLIERPKDESTRAGLAPLREALAQAAAEALTTARRFLAEPARAAEERRLALLLEGLPSYAARPSRLPRRLSRRAGEIAVELDKKKLNLRNLHPARLAAKQVRYGLEPLALLDKSLEPALAEMTALQRALGECRDWRRLAQRLDEAGAPESLARRARRRARKAFDAAPSALPETLLLTRARWTAPPLEAFAARLEKLRYLIERSRHGKARRHAARTAKIYLPPIAALEEEPARKLRAQFETLKEYARGRESL